MKIDIWSDIACPFCYIGITQFNSALSKFAHKGEVEVKYHSFELDPSAPKAANESMAEMLVRKKGMPESQVAGLLENIKGSAGAVGLDFKLNDAKVVNTFDAHRLVHAAAESGKSSEMMNLLYKAYFTDGENIADHETLARLAKEVGLDEKSIEADLGSDAYSDEVKSDISLAANYGIQGVPFFIVDEKYGISGAQGEAAFVEVLSKVWHEKNPLTMVGAESGGAGVCQDGFCAVE